MATAGKGIFFDGVTSARRPVLVELTSDGLLVRDAEERAMLARWPYNELDHLAAPEGVLRLGRASAPRLARLEVRDPALAHAIDDASVPVDRSGAAERRGRIKVVVWAFVATVSLLLAAIFGVPALADKIAPLVPLRAERWLGEAVDIQARKMLDKGDTGRPFECGNQEGRAALASLIGRLEAPAALSIPLQAKVVRRSEANAIALPGGHGIKPRHDLGAGAAFVRDLGEVFVFDDRRKLRFLVVGKVAAGLVEFDLANMGRYHWQVAAVKLFLAQETLKQVTQYSSFGQPERQP